MNLRVFLTGKENLKALVVITRLALLTAFILSISLLFSPHPSVAGEPRDGPRPAGSTTTKKLSYSVEGDIFHVYLENLDGTDRELVFSEPAAQMYSGLLALSPDESRIAYVTAAVKNMSDARIWVINSDGTGKVLVATPDHGSWVTNPVWSPDGQQLAYIRILPYHARYKAELWTAILDVGGPKYKLVTDRPSFHPNLFFGKTRALWWTPDGQAIQYADESNHSLILYQVQVLSGAIREIDSTLMVGGAKEYFEKRTRISATFSGMIKPIFANDYDGTHCGVPNTGNDNTKYTVLYLDTYVAPYSRCDQGFEGSGSHPGVDISWAGIRGTKVLAIGDGILEDAGWKGAWGWAVVIAHPDVPYVGEYGGTVFSVYAHLLEGSIPSDFNWSKPIAIGVYLGKVNSSSNAGRSTGDHLHFQLDKHNTTHPFWLQARPGQCVGAGCPITDPRNVVNNPDTDGQVTTHTFNPMRFVQAHPPYCPANLSSANASDYTMTEYCPATPTPTPSPSAVDNATFIADVTIPDGTVLSPNESFDKTWRLRNSGTSTWTTDYKLCFIGGDQMGGPDCATVPGTVAPGQEVDISVHLTAADSSGDYQGNWRMQNASGVQFGDTVWVKVTVPGTTPATPTPTVPDDIEVQTRDYPRVVSPGHQFRPAITIHLNSGELRESRGDMLRYKSGELFGAWPHVAVVDTVYAGQNYTFRFYEDHPITAPSSEGTYVSVWQVWADGRWVGPEIPIRFEVHQTDPGNRQPEGVTLLSPTNGTVIPVGHSVDLCFQLNDDPDGHRLTEAKAHVTRVGPEAPPHQAPAEFDLTTVPDNNDARVCLTTPNLDETEYEWSAWVKDEHNLDSPRSSFWRFRIDSQHSTLELLEISPPSPSTGDERNEVTVHARMSYCSQGMTIRMEVNTASDGSADGEWIPFYEIGTFEGTGKWQTLPFDNGQHRLRILARGCGALTWKEAGSIEYPDCDECLYELLDRPPARPVLLSPDDKAWVNSRQVVFVWDPGMVGDAPPRATSYTLHVSTNSNPEDNPLLDVTVLAPQTSYTYTFDADYPSLSWRGWANSSLGSWDSFSRQFGIDRQAPSSAVDDLPSTTTETKFTVNWSGQDNPVTAGTFSGIRWYDVQYRDGERGEWTNWQLGTTAFNAIFTGQAGHRYCFRSRALDNAGNQEPYPPGDGDTCTTVDPTAAPPTPWYDPVFSTRRNIVVLNRDSHPLPAGYPIHLYFDDTTIPTAAELYAASLAATKGDDFRIVQDNQVELDRFVQNFTPERIDIWFGTQTEIAPYASDSSSYQLYYGNAVPSTPPTDLNNVFFGLNDPNAVGLWHFQDGAGSTVTDSSGRGHHGIASNMTWDSDGRFGWAGSFNGSSSTVNVGNSGDFNFPGSFTLEGWVNFSDHNSNRNLIQKESLGGGYNLTTQDDQFRFNIHGNDYPVTDGRRPGMGTWYHVAAVYDVSSNRRMQIYIDGVPGAWRENVPQPNPTSANLRFGSSDWNDAFFNGKLQHLRLSNVARTSFPYARITDNPSAEVGAATPYTPPQTGSPDLVVSNPTAYPAASGGLIIQATVVNSSTVSTPSGFYIDLYSDHQPAGPGDFQNSIRYWVASPVEAGTALTLTTLITEPVALQGLTSATVAAPRSEVTATLYTQVDSTGVVSESEELNNISSGTEICLAAPDAYESDNTATQATPLSLGVPQTHNIHAVGDQDWFTFTARSGVTYTVQTEELGLSADTYLYLYACPEPCRMDADGATLLAANDDYGGSLASRLDWWAPANGTYYLLVRHWNPNQGGCGTSYDLLVTEKLFGDFDSNCEVDVADIMQVASRWNTAVGDPRYDPHYDFDDTGEIDVVDIMTIAAQWGDTCE